MEGKPPLQIRMKTGTSNHPILIEDQSGSKIRELPPQAPTISTLSSYIFPGRTTEIEAVKKKPQVSIPRGSTDHPCLSERESEACNFLATSALAGVGFIGTMIYSWLTVPQFNGTSALQAVFLGYFLSLGGMFFANRLSKLCDHFALLDGAKGNDKPILHRNFFRTEDCTWQSQEVHSTVLQFIGSFFLHHFTRDKRLEIFRPASHFVACAYAIPQILFVDMNLPHFLAVAMGYTMLIGAVKGSCSFESERKLHEAVQQIEREKLSNSLPYKSGDSK
jgi:hypothetical protein